MSIFQDGVRSPTSTILAKRLLNNETFESRPKKKKKKKSNHLHFEGGVVNPSDSLSPPRAWIDWFIEQSGAEGIKENLDLKCKSKGKSSSKTSLDNKPTETGNAKKKRKSTPCVRRKIGHVLKPEEITEDMLVKVAAKPKDKLYDQENGTSCHQCRQKTSDTKTICRSGRCVGLRGFFCGPCLRTRYGEDAKEALLDPQWSCPVCRGICNCSLCRKAYGHRAVGQIVQRLGKMGYNSVQEYLESSKNTGDDVTPDFVEEATNEQEKIDNLPTIESEVNIENNEIKIEKEFLE